jgi:hypothetical protein
MKSIYHYQRSSAAQDFQQSLTQLENILHTDSSHQTKMRESNNCNNSRHQNRSNTEDFDLAALEDAVADIDQYLAQKQQNK